MLLKALTLENFKGIREPVRVEFKPITLLFGSNSAGKSTLLHGLVYLFDVISRHNLDPDRMRLSATFMDMGGFHALVNNHDLGNSIRLVAELDIRGVDLHAEVLTTATARLAGIDRPFDTTRYFHELSTAALDIRIAWSDTRAAPYVSEYRVSLDDAVIAKITSSPDCRRVEISFLNTDHSAFQLARNADDALMSNALRPLLETAVQPVLLGDGKHTLIGLLGQADALPSIHLPFSLDDIWLEPASHSQFELTRHYERRQALHDLLTVILLAPLRLLHKELGQFRYLGPLRELPPRNFLPLRSPEASRWSHGLAAWDLLFACDRPFLKKLNTTLSKRSGLDAGYEVKVTRYKTLDLESPILALLENKRALALDEMAQVQAALARLPVQTRVTLIDTVGAVEVTPHDMGVGISQMLPVVVMALSGTSGITAIEQPELHIHPAMQVKLGDVFISEVNAKPQVFLLETHSEHLMLRLLRRIRETTDGVAPEADINLTPDQVNVIWVAHEADRTRFDPLRIGTDGYFIDRWPKGFFDERVEEVL